MLIRLDRSPFEEGQKVWLRKTNEVGLVLASCGRGDYEVLVLGVNNEPTNVKWILGSNMMEPYTGQDR